MNHIEKTEGKVVIKRNFSASRQQLFAAWTNPEKMKEWMLGPEGIDATCELKVGGQFSVRSFVPGTQQEMGISGRFDVVRPDEALKYTFRWDGDSDDDQTFVSVAFSDHEEGASVTVTHEKFRSAESRDNHTKGWCDCIDILGGLLASPNF